MVRKVKPIIYIFCEGQTEEKYFKKLKRILRNTSFQVKTFDLEGGTKILDHPERVKRLIINKLKHDKITGITQKVFIVFDLDIFNKTKLQNTINTLKDYSLIVTNEIFEYWILLHFEKYDLGRGKRHYLGKIKRYLPSLENDKFTGRKDFDWLSTEKIDLAIKNTKSINTLFSSTLSLKDRDPYSNVYEIIEYLSK